MDSPDAPEEQGPTAEEIELSRQGVEKYNRYERQYAPLEDQMVAGVNRPTQNLLAGRTNADIMQEATRTATQSIESGNITQGLASLDSLRSGLAKAGSTNAVSSIAGDRDNQDERALGAIETGLGMSGRQQRGLTQLASNANNEALNELNNEVMMNGVKANNQAQLAGAILGSGADAYDEYRTEKRLDKLFRADKLSMSTLSDY